LNQATAFSFNTDRQSKLNKHRYSSAVINKIQKFRTRMQKNSKHRCVTNSGAKTTCWLSEMIFAFLYADISTQNASEQFRCMCPPSCVNFALPPNPQKNLTELRLDTDTITFQAIYLSSWITLYNSSLRPKNHKAVYMFHYIHFINFYYTFLGGYLFIARYSISYAQLTTHLQLTVVQLL